MDDVEPIPMRFSCFAAPDARQVDSVCHCKTTTHIPSWLYLFLPLCLVYLDIFFAMAVEAAERQHVLVAVSMRNVEFAQCRQ